MVNIGLLMNFVVWRLKAEVFLRGCSRPTSHYDLSPPFFISSETGTKDLH